MLDTPSTSAPEKLSLSEDDISNHSSSWNIEHSPFASVIGTNHVPSTAELKSLKELLVHPQLELSRLEKEIDRFQTILSGLLSEKRQVVAYIKAHRALASPVRQIPPETLAEIFIQCLPTEPSYPLRDLNEAPLLFTTICRHWRSVALITPRLWNSLHLFFPSQWSRDACSRRIAGATLWLQRSGSLPLSISLHGSTIPVVNYWPAPERDSPILQRRIESMFRSLMSFSDRFRDIFLSLSSSSFSIFDKLSPAVFPALATLRVRDIDVSGRYDKAYNQPSGVAAGDVAAFAPLLSRMPFLKKLEVNLIFVRDQNYSSLPCNWRNLTNLVISDFLPSVGVVAILAETPQIQSISFSISFGDDDANLDSAVVHLNDLTEMRLQVEHSTHYMEKEVLDRFFQTHVTSLIKHIQCPSLRLLSFTADWAYITVSKWPFTGLPLHNLEILHLSMPLNPDALTECLSQTPNLARFQLKTRSPEFPLHDSHLHSLTLSPNNPDPSWPRLQTILIFAHPRERDLAYGLVLSFTTTAVTTFLQSRYQTTPLKSCDLMFNAKPEPFFSDAELDTLRNLKRNEMKIRLVHYHVQLPPHSSRTYHDPPDAGISGKSVGDELKEHSADIENRFSAAVTIL
ncbi:hypothetical protein BT96DRAFT_921201 [Gymnopus androsaceus JB14]|uniref:Uncharacterized protein n=1 Tax=Gymnopus androsaceus JB14 TaxID=1447944 RepID=A0A6A4HK34_9AGAR|nr:hypothetical protein BT96DRAFT_921201 [Gymnopus androsaceus JB14]